MRDDHRPATIDIRPAERQVLVGGEPAVLGARAFDLLMALYERRDRVVAKNELLDLVWPGLVVEENNLQVQVSTLRKVLGPAAIATIPGRGYRFTLPADALAAKTTAAEPDAAHAGIAGVGTNLPAAPPLFGRADELAEVGRLLAECPVVSIVGAGGIGKTRLALALAAAATPPAPDGRWWIDLAPINEGRQVMTAIAGALGIQLPASGPTADALASSLSTLRLLLVLDNCEHIAEAVAPLIEVIRARAPGVRLLITSQESLKCVDEQVYRLASLEVPRTDDPEEASRFGAVALFVARARAVDPRFRLGADNLGAVLDVCRRLDGIPLAIELAAARVPTLGVLGLQARLDQMFNVLTGVDRMKLRRHQTLRAALDWSCGLLSEDERTVFRRLGVFAGGFTLELAQGVTHDAAIDAWRVLDLLGQLIDKSLVIADGEGEPRYRLLEPTRAFALEQLAAAGESAAILRRHAEAVAQAMEECDAARWTEPSARRMRRLAEIGNLRAALDWAMSAEGDRPLAYRLLGYGWFIFFGNNLHAECFDRMMKLWPPAPGLPDDDAATFCLALLSLRGFLARDEVLQAARRALDHFRARGDHRLFDALYRSAQLGMARDDAGWTDAAVREAESLVDASTPPRKLASLAMIQGARALGKQEFAAARACFLRQVECCRREGSELGEFAALTNVAMVDLDIGEIDSAIDCLHRIIAGVRRHGAPYLLPVPRALLAVALAIRGDAVDVLAMAREAYELVAPIGRDSAFKPFMVAALHHARHGDAARAALVAGHARAALRHLRSPCVIDARIEAQVTELAGQASSPAAVEAWLAAGERLTQQQAAALAFEGAATDGFR